MLQRLQILLDLAGNIAGAVHHAFINYIQEGLVNLNSSFQQGIERLNFPPDDKHEIIPGDRWTTRHKIGILHKTVRYPFAV
jgi:hypothetical protein